jgi:hypothetical protein
LLRFHKNFSGKFYISFHVGIDWNKDKINSKAMLPTKENGGRNYALAGCWITGNGTKMATERIGRY